MQIEFIGFVRMLLRLLKSGQVQEAIEELEKLLPRD